MATASRNGSAREIILGLGLALFSIAVTLGLGELAFRILDVPSGLVPPRIVEVPNADGGWEPVAAWGTLPVKRASPFPAVHGGEYVPHSRFRFAYYDDFDHVFDGAHVVHDDVAHINALGCRGADFPREKPPGVYRILFVGDSFTFGEGVGDDEPFPVRVEAALNASSPPRRVQAVNAGVAGYNTKDEVIYLERRWLALDPDLVVITFFLNDAYDDERFAALEMGQAGGHLGYNVLIPSRLLRWAVARWKGWRLGRSVRETYRAQFSGNPAIEGHDWRDVQASLIHASELLRQRGVPLVLVIFPELYDLGPDHPFADIYEQVAAFARDHGIPVLNLYPPFASRRAEELWVFVNDHHPNAAAHALAADAIVGFLRAQTPPLVP